MFLFLFTPLKFTYFCWAAKGSMASEPAPHITLTADFGRRDHYEAAVRATVKARNAQIEFTNISLEIEQYNIVHGAFVLRSVYDIFPKGSVHIFAVNAHGASDVRYLACKLHEHYFIGPDNGFLSLISEEDPSSVVRIDDGAAYAFPARDLFADVALRLMQSESLHELGEETESPRRMLARQLKVTKDQIMGNVVHIDHYGNLITNIDKGNFDKVRDKRDFEIRFFREKVRKLSESYAQVDPGDCLVLFNAQGLLEIAINQGNAAELLGLHYDSPVYVRFGDGARRDA